MATDIAGIGTGASVFNNRESESGSQARFVENFDTFLRLLTAQLTHQDPLSPLDTHQFTSQLVQFASVEQQIEQSSNLRKLLDLIEGNQLTSSLSYIGKSVEYRGNQFQLNDEGNTTLKYELPEGAETATLRILDENNQTVFTTSIQAETGLQSIVWDGNGIAPGETAESRRAAGNYQVIIDMTHRESNEEYLGLVTYYSPATVIGVQDNKSEGLKLNLSVGQEVDIDDVLSVSQLG